MFNSIKVWRDKRKMRKLEERYTAGFKWAMAAYYLEHMSLEKIDGYIWDGSSMPDYLVTHTGLNIDDEFDRGAAYGVRVIAQNQQVQNG